MGGKSYFKGGGNIMKAGKFFLVLLLTLWLASLSASAWAAYSAHQNDQDVNNFLAVYPFAKSTKLDDCSLCHKGGCITASGRTSYYGSCDYCHQIYKTQPPHGNILDTLNSYGKAYNGAGANQDALKAIEGLNSDGEDKLTDCSGKEIPNNDKSTNIEEILALAFPGDARDYPGLVPAPAIGMNLERLLKLPSYSQLLLLNASNSRDFYARYRGVKILDLLKHAGISKKATQITVYSPDGFSQTFPIDVPDPQTDPSKVQYDVMGPYPYGTYYGGLDFVDYSVIPGCIDNGDRIPDKLYMLLAYMRDGDPLTPGKINPTTLRLDGEGPYRLIPPQKIAGSPDRGCSGPQVDPDDGWNCDRINKEHNAGFSARTVAAIRVDPLPVGTTDFNWYEGGWNLVDRAKLVIYGAIHPRTYTVSGKVSNTSSGKGVPDVKLSFSLLSLGNVGEATTSSGRGYSKKKEERGKFSTELPAGEYTVVPSKEGCTFTPASLLISLPDPECDLDRDDHDSWDHRERWNHCDRHPDYEINIIASCTP
jgi:hypothetical protein